jgi:hypothetical protein
MPGNCGAQCLPIAWRETEGCKVAEEGGLKVGCLLGAVSGALGRKVLEKETLGLVIAVREEEVGSVHDEAQASGVDEDEELAMMRPVRDRQRWCVHRHLHDGSGLTLCASCGSCIAWLTVHATTAFACWSSGVAVLQPTSRLWCRCLA